MVSAPLQGATCWFDPIVAVPCGLRSCELAPPKATQGISAAPLSEGGAHDAYGLGPPSITAQAPAEHPGHPSRTRARYGDDLPNSRLDLRAAPEAFRSGECRAVGVPHVDAGDLIAVALHEPIQREETRTDGKRRLLLCVVACRVPRAYADRTAFGSQAQAPRHGVEYAINADQAKVVREIFERYADGWRLKKIVKDLNARKIVSPSSGKRGTGRGHICGDGRFTPFSSGAATEAGSPGASTEDVITDALKVLRRRLTDRTKCTSTEVQATEAKRLKAEIDKLVPVVAAGVSQVDALGQGLAERQENSPSSTRASASRRPRPRRSRRSSDVSSAMHAPDGTELRSALEAHPPKREPS
jgi:hypothetical protein